MILVIQFKKKKKNIAKNKKTKKVKKARIVKSSLLVHRKKNKVNN